MSKKVLHIIDSLGLGGAQTVVRGIMEYQQSEVDFHLYSLREHSIHMEINAKNINIYHSKNKFSFPLFQLKKYIQDNNIEILHCHLAKSQIMGGILKILFFPKIKLIFHEHSGIVEDGKMYAFLMNFFQKKLDTFIAVSEFLKQKLIENAKIDASKILLLYNFVNTKKFFKNQKEKGDGGIKIGFAGRLMERKGWKEFIVCAKNFSHKNIQFLMAGDGPEKEGVLRAISDSKNIKFIGYQSDMNKFYNNIDIFILPSHYEGLSMAQLESMSAGCVVISSDGPGLDEIITDGIDGFYFQAKNGNDLVKKLDLVLENFSEKRNIISENAQNTALKYSIDIYMQGLIKLYNNI